MPPTTAQRCGKFKIRCGKCFVLNSLLDFYHIPPPYEVNNLPNGKGVLVDLAAGGCNFINNIHSGMEEYAFDINPDVKGFAREGIKVVVDQIDNLADHFEEGSVSVFF